VKADEGVGCLDFKQENFALFQELMAIGANEILKTFDEDKRFFLNFLLDITPYCDCWGIAFPHVVNDIGVLGSRDIIAIEQASLDLIAKEGLIESMIPPFFRVHNDPELHPFQQLHGPMKDPYLTVDYGEKLGMGTKDYRLIEILSPKKTANQKGPKTVSEPSQSFF